MIILTVIHIDSNVYTGIIVAAATIFQQYLKRRSDRIRSEEAAAASNKVLSAVAENTSITKNVNTKLEDKVVQTIPSDIIDKMLGMEKSVSPADIAKILVQMKSSAAAEEKYAHNNVHRINNILMVFQAQLELKNLDPMPRRSQTSRAENIRETSRADAEIKQIERGKDE